eukprot:Phypoly_transcript_04103.p1 GENE.Phypoly_transcript_04103~~Phypoly_transcript_04103.p1  ORF type:complete len:713 (+),score=143.20 Phypoly_transcript_04103:69-2207(+)
MNKRAYEGPTMADPGVPVHHNKRREILDAAVEKIDEELANMRTSKDANVQVRGCVNLWQMAADPDTRKALASTSAIQLILSTINSNSNHIGIVTVALNTLCCILSSDQNSKVIAANSKLMASFGGINSILDIARKHINNEFVCKRGCELLTIFANGNQDVKKGICCVLEMMHAHLAHGEVQFAAFGILSVFPPTDYSKEEITEIITSVLESLQECREDVAVQWKGLVLLRKLTKNQNGSPVLLQKGGVAIIMRALRKHQTHDIICERGFQILQHLSSAGRQFARDITINGGLSVIVGALKCHTNNGTIQLYGLRLISTILGWDLHTYMKGGVECVLAAMRTFTYDVEIQEYACGILSILAEQDDYRTLIMIDGGVDLLVLAMKTHLVSVAVNVAVCKTLSHLYMIIEVCRERQIMEMIDCVLLTMRVHQQNLTIQRHACSLLELLADNPRYKHEIIVRGGRACVKTAIFSVDLNGRSLLQKLSRKTLELQPPSDLGKHSNLRLPKTENNTNNRNLDFPANYNDTNNNDNNTPSYSYKFQNNFSIPDLYDDDIQIPAKPFTSDYEADFVDTAISNFNSFGDDHFTSSDFEPRMSNNNNTNITKSGIPQNRTTNNNNNNNNNNYDNNNNNSNTNYKPDTFNFTAYHYPPTTSTTTSSPPPFPFASTSSPLPFPATPPSFSTTPSSPPPFPTTSSLSSPPFSSCVEDSKMDVDFP